MIIDKGVFLDREGAVSQGGLAAVWGVDTRTGVPGSWFLVLRCASSEREWEWVGVDTRKGYSWLAAVGVF